MIASDDHNVSDQPQASSPGLVARSFYSAGYYLSYGVVLPVAWVASVLPTDNVVGHGLCDGAIAAGDSSRIVNQKVCDATRAVGHKAGDAYAGVARNVQQRVESIQDAVAERKHRRRLAPA